MPSTVIIGGGLSGLAAASALAHRGVKVTLLESRPRLGGRASSFVDRTTGEQIDNCQHVSMGCCTNFQKFCETVGIAHYFRRESKLNFIGTDGKLNTLQGGWLPAPLHLLPGFRRLSYLSQTDQQCLAKGLRALAQLNPDDAGSIVFADWLREQRQTPAAIERFWHVVLVSALSETLDRIDVASARKVFVDAFLANRHGWEVQIPTVPLDELYGSQLNNWLTTRNATIRLQSGVEGVEIDGDRVAAVKLRDGERIEADDYVLAVPHYRVADLLPESLRDIPQINGLQRLESAPISSVHLWFNRPVTELPHAVLIERLSQWMFNRTKILQSGKRKAESGTGLEAARYYYQVVISASRSLADMTQQQVIDAVVSELKEIWPDAREAEVVHSRLVTEHKAVFSVLPESSRFRPQQQSPIANLQFAGDWTQTGWPATMEGAVRSGYLAAENILARCRRPENLLAADLPVAPLSKLLLGL